ncbi:MAG: hypothetical protein LBE08_06850 [Bifidobacteriaceae bacterium]|jgi:hypothetical protein|nr:hypothetical protein [Bifidobacteriaceae bacterium]
MMLSRMSQPRRPSSRFKHDAGSTLVEVIVSVVLLTVFSSAAMVAVTSSTATSTDNRARVTASGLAVRELDLVGELIAASATGADDILNQVVVNGTVEASMQGENPDFPYLLDGEEYRVERRADAYPLVNKGAACEATGSPVTQMRQGTLVTVTVTWASQKEVTQPHVARKLFAPHRNSGTGMAPGQAVIAVKVEGKITVSGTTDRAGVQVQVVGAGTGQTQVTDSKGCAVFSVYPGSASVLYEVTVGTPGGGYTTTAGNPTPVLQVGPLTEGDWQQAPLQDYDPAASLTVKVLKINELVQQVDLEPAAGEAGDARHLPLEGGDTVKFEHVYPGTYAIIVYGADTKMVTLLPGAHEYKEVEVK